MLPGPWNSPGAGDTERTARTKQRLSWSLLLTLPLLKSTHQDAPERHAQGESVSPGTCDLATHPVLA